MCASLEKVIDGLNATIVDLTTKLKLLRKEVVRVKDEATSHGIEAGFKIFR